MKTDIYTKIVLTVIAIFLGVLVFQNTTLITSAKADTTADTPSPIPTATQSAPVDVNITHIDGKKINIIHYLIDTSEKDQLRKTEGLPIEIRSNRDK
ncbi:hypothetical protein [Dysgonomonas capnocytophagoides]|uniref:hypothetical protein n=1 Tax=Dysgonomonas capnocytophagoides TaxID=45254 RepID=UPI003341C3D7